MPAPYGCFAFEMPHLLGINSQNVYNINPMGLYTDVVHFCISKGTF
jgi:hypothetical protein